MKARIPSVFIAHLIVCLGLLPNAYAVNPPPDGGYPNGNTAVGQSALFSLTSGTYNTAIGLFSLRSNTTGGFNTGVGAGTLLTNSGSENTAIGAGALLSNTTGTSNTATGESALLSNATAVNNTATGASALLNNTTGNNNTATGLQALGNNTTGGDNTATGVQALLSNTTGNSNIATGLQALGNNTTGGNNTATGWHALLSNTTGTENTALGVEAGRDQTTGSGNVYIGRSMVGVAGESNKTYVRNINSTGLNGTAVTVDVNTGLLGHATSSRRYKEEVQPMDQSSEALFQLKPVTFRYKKEIDRTHALSFGLIAEEVAEVNPDLIVRDRAGRPETVRYEAVNAMLLNEFLKEHRKVEQLENQVEALTAGLQKVSTQLATASPSRGGLEASKPEAQTVSNQR